jgi:hypothetical protein
MTELLWTLVVEMRDTINVETKEHVVHRHPIRRSNPL